MSRECRVKLALFFYPQVSVVKFDLSFIIYNMKLDNYDKSFCKETAHQTLVNRILEVSEQDKSQYKFWLAMVSRSKKTMNEILDVCDLAQKIDSKYNKGGFIRKRI